MSARSKPSPPDDDLVELHTIPQAARRLGVSVNHVYRMIAEGDLRAVDTALPSSKRSKTRVRSDDVTAWIQAHTRTAVSATSARTEASSAA